MNQSSLSESVVFRLIGRVQANRSCPCELAETRLIGRVKINRAELRLIGAS